MIQRRFLPNTMAWLAVLALAACTLAPTRASAQVKGEERLPYDEKAYKEKAKAINNLLSGENQVKYDPQQHDADLDLLAKHYAYRLTFLENQNKTTPSATPMSKLVEQARAELYPKKKEDVNQEAMRKFRELLLKRLREVLPNPKPIAAMNAARILTLMAEQGQEEVADAFVDVLKDPTKYDDATSFIAIQGLKAFFQLANRTENPFQFKDKQREVKAIKVLVGAVERKWPAVTNAEEREGQRFWRREAIRALGLTRYPAVMDEKGAVVGKTALALLRVVRNDSLSPPPRYDEQFEAAVAVANLKAMPVKDYKLPTPYQPDVAAQHLGRFITATARHLRTPIGVDASIPWKTMSARLADALATLQADTTKNSKEAAATVTKIVTEGRKVLSALEEGAVPQPLQLSNALQAAKLDASPVYKGDKDSVVKPAVEKEAEAPPEKPAEPKKP
jgi:hypothetical protein